MSTQDNDAVPVNRESAAPQQPVTPDVTNDGPGANDAPATAELEIRLRRAVAEVDNVRKVAQVVRPGYGDGHALLRPSAVLVAADRG